MSGSPTSTGLVQLPGPAGFVSRATADLTAGQSVILVFPDALVDSGVADAVLDDLAAEGTTAVSCISSTDSFPARVMETFGGDPVRESEVAEWERIAGWERWHGSWVFFPSWEHPDVAEVIDRWPAQLNACCLSMDARPKLIIAVRLTDVPRTRITHVDRNNIAVHWWWGVLGRLDTELRLAAITQRPLNPVNTAVIVEVSGWDLSCTDFLANEWDRSTSGISDALHAYQSQADAGCATPVVAVTRRGLTAPPAELEQPWCKGLLDWWGHGIRLAGAAIDDAELMQRVWMAHNRALIQYVDEERAHYEQMILAKAPRDTLTDLRQRDDDIIEIGSLTWLVESRRVDIGKKDRERLQTFRDLRNDLAHRKPVSDELLRRVVGYLEF